MASSYLGSASHDQAGASSSAVLLLNLGTPSAPNAWALRRYLREFLSDPRVIELPRWLWLPALYGVILPLRAPRSARAYREIWTPQGSPLLVQSQRLAEALEQGLRRSGLSTPVRLAMRYGEPSIPSVLRELHGQGLRRLLVLPATDVSPYTARVTQYRHDAAVMAARHIAPDPPLRAAASIPVP